MRVLALVIALLMGLPHNGMPKETQGDGDRAVPALELLTVEADEGITVVDWNVVPAASEGDAYDAFYLFAEIRNDGNQAVWLLGRTQFLDAQGEELRKSVTEEFFPRYLAPGQTGYLTTAYDSWLWNRRATPDTLSEIRLTMESDEAHFFRQTYWYGLPATAMYLPRGARVEETGDGLRVSWRNETGLMLPNPSVAVGAYDAEGRLLYVLADEVTTGNSGHDCYVPDGSGFALELTLEAEVREYLERRGDVAAEYRGIVYGRLRP